MGRCGSGYTKPEGGDTDIRLAANSRYNVGGIGVCDNRVRTSTASSRRLRAVALLTHPSSAVVFFSRIGPWRST